MTAAQVKRLTGLPEASFLHLRVGTVVNPKNVCLHRCGVYYWKDVAQLCLAQGLEMPE